MVSAHGPVCRKQKMISTQKHIKQVSAKAFFIIAFLLVHLFSQAQEKKPIIEGNKQYKKKNYTEAEKKYKEALSKNKNSYKGSFNLGDTYYKQGKYAEAAEQFQLLTHRATSKDTLAKAYHNLGNALLKSKKYQESINAYKNALKNNPNDQDTRYNLSYAQQMLKQQQQKKEKKENKEQEKKEKEEKKEQPKKKEQEKPQEKKDEISKEDAQRLLDAMENDEKKIQDKIKKGKPKVLKKSKSKIEKDW